MASDKTADAQNISELDSNTGVLIDLQVCLSFIHYYGFALFYIFDMQTA